MLYKRGFTQFLIFRESISNGRQIIFVLHTEHKLLNFGKDVNVCVLHFFPLMCSEAVFPYSIC